MEKLDRKSILEYCRKVIESPVFSQDLSRLRETGVKLAFSDDRFVEFLSKQLSLDKTVVRELSRDLIVMIQSSLLKPYREKYERREETRVKTDDRYIHVNTIANTLYFALKQAHGSSSSKKMYEILEKRVIDTLTNGTEEASVLFMPISPENMGKALGVLREILVENREICGAREILETLCVKSSFLSQKQSLLCLEKLREILSEVCE